MPPGVSRGSGGALVANLQVYLSQSFEIWNTQGPPKLQSCMGLYVGGPWSRPERTGAKRRALALGRAPAPVWAIASVLARNESSRRIWLQADLEQIRQSIVTVVVYQK